MHNLKHWEDKIKQKRNDSDFRDLEKELTGWIESKCD